MTVKELAQKLELNFLVEADADRQVLSGYCGDLLSWVMSRAKEGDCWFTVMGNINCVAVAVLGDCACIVLCENAVLDDDARLRAEQQGVNILQSEENSFNLSVKLGKLL
ncbi:MAG: hypothetical protein IJL63_02740 [Clostridia bacterium]|nr:hypothetical protein [Clostridia bacterium]